MWVRSLALLSGLGIQCCRELWCRWQMWLGSGVAVAVAVAVAGSCSFNLTPSLETSICLRCGPKKQTNQKIEMIQIYLSIYAIKGKAISYFNPFPQT